MLSADDRQLILRDTELPGLPLLLDQEALCAFLTPLLPSAPCELRLDYLRYKPQTSCLLGVDVSTNNETRYVCVHACRRRDLDKILKLAKRSPALPGREPAVLPEQSVVVSFFPADRRLKSLPDLTRTESRRDVLARVFPDDPQYWEGTLNVLRYKPERRFVAQLLLEGRPAAVLKLHTPRNYQQACANAKIFRSQASLRVARRIGRSARHRIVAFDWRGGSPLSEFLLAPKDDPPDLARVGAALAELHTQYSRRLKPRTRAEEVRSLKRISEWIGFLCPSLEDRLRSLVAKMTNSLLKMPNFDCGIHGDFYACQVLCNRDHVALLDLDRASSGDPATDLGNFIAHLEWNAIQGLLSEMRVASLSDAFLGGYEGMRYQTAVSRAPFYVAAGLVHLAPRPFRDRLPQWEEQTRQIIDRATRIIEQAAPTGGRFSGLNLRSSPSPEPPVSVVDPFRVTKDPAMGFLAEALDPSFAKREVQHRIAANIIDNHAMHMRTIRVTRHKPGRRCILEYEFESEHAAPVPQTVTIIGKVRRKGTDERTYRVVKALWESTFHESSEDGISVPEVFGTIPQWKMVLYRKIAGTVSRDLLLHEKDTALAERIAEAAHKLHTAPIPTRRTHTITDELGILHRKLPLVAEERPDWSDRIGRVLHACDRLGSSMPTPTPCGIHRDFYPDQVLVQGERLYLLDFDLYCLGDPATDIGNFLGHLIEQSVREQGDPESLALIETTLKERFLQLSGPSLRAAVEAYTTLTLARHIYLSTQFPKRRPFTEQILALCEARFELGAAAMQGGRQRKPEKHRLDFCGTSGRKCGLTSRDDGFEIETSD